MKGTEIVVPSKEIVAPSKEIKKPSRLTQVVGYVRENPIVSLSILITLVYITVAIFPDYIAPYDPNYQNFAQRLQPPGPGHILGTDSFGRDLFSRIIYGAKISVYVGILATTLAMVFGTVLGIASGYFGGWFDIIMMRLVDMVMSFPQLLLALLIVATMGSNMKNVIIAIGVASVPRIVRLARAPALAIKEMEYIEAARALGLPNWRIIIFHVLPNAMGPIIVVSTLLIGNAMLAEAGLSFLGLGVSPPEATWGNIMNDGIAKMKSAPWIVIYSGLAIMVIVLALNILGDYLRDINDPKLRGEKGRN